LKVLYITYYGLLKHLCQAQVIPYLEGLAADGVEIFVLSFEERTGTRDEQESRMQMVRARLGASGIQWYPLRYHKRPSLPATAYDVLFGTFHAAHLVRRNRIQIVHARNHIPALMALVLKRALGTKLIFDLRGIMAEEYVDAGVWRSNGIPFRLTKWVEESALRHADGIVMLTRKIRDVLRTSSPGLAANPADVEIIPCCVDTRKYANADGESVRRELGLAGKQVLVYAGSLGGWYMSDEMAALFSELLRLRANAHFLILTQSRYELITSSLTRHGIAAERYTVMTANADEMPRYLAAGDLGVSFIKPCFSKLSSSPTKIGEYLASGLPFITNRGIGDVDELLKQRSVGVLIDSFRPEEYRSALQRVLEMLSNQTAIRRQCQRVAEEEFSLSEIGRALYRGVYERVGAMAPREADSESVMARGATP